MRTLLLSFIGLALAGAVLLAPLPMAGQARASLEETPLLGSPVVVTPIAGPSSQRQPDTTAPAMQPTPQASSGPDRCERNEAPGHACALTLDAVNGPFSFLPAGDQDWYRVELPSAGLQTVVTVRGTAGLELFTTLSRDDGSPLGTIASPVTSTTLAPDIAGGVLIRVENRDPGARAEDQYNLEIRRALPPPPAAPPAEGGAALPPDALENNWSPSTAAPIGVGVAYDLNFVCPVPWGCAGGDHDYLRLPVKAGVRYLIATFDLGPGVDTVLDLFWGDETHALAANDDARAGASLLSVLRWVAPADGEAILRVGPRTGGLSPTVLDEQAGSYRFAVALADSELAHQLEDRIADQTNAPAPPARPTPASGAAGGPAPAAPAPPPTVVPTTPPVSTDAPTGAARVSAAETALREGPSATAPAIQTLPAEAVVTLLGQASGAWVRVQPVDGVVPGWVRGADLTLEPATANAAEAAPTSAPADASAAAATATLEPTAATFRVAPLEPLPPPPLPPPAQHSSIAISVRVVAVDEPLVSVAGKPAPTPAAEHVRPLTGVRVRLVSAFGDPLAEALTDSRGHVRLTTSIAGSIALFVQLPAPGLTVPVLPGEAELLLTLAANEGGAP